MEYVELLMKSYKTHQKWNYSFLPHHENVYEYT